MPLYLTYTAPLTPSNASKGMVRNLVEKVSLTDPLILHNRTRSRAEAYQSSLKDPSAVTIAESLAAGVAAADIIFTCLADDAAISSAIEEALKGDVKGKLFVDCSTVHPDTTTVLGGRVEEKGADFVAAPVFGAPAMADAGMLIAVLAGAPSAVAKARPYFKGATASVEIDLSSPDHTAQASWTRASTLKILGNTFILNMAEQLAQGFTAAEKSGLGTAPLLAFVEAVFPGPYTAYAHRMLSGDYHTREEPLFAVDLARKDLRHAADLAGAAGVRMPSAEAADRHLVKVKERQGPKGDMAGIYGAVREEAGLKFENS